MGKDKAPKRKQTLGEEIANAISHGVIALVGIAFLVYMLVKSNGEARKIAGAIIYGISIVLLYTFSCLYHALTNNTAKNVVFKRFDHISIYLLIGGTYAPILLNLPSLAAASFVPGVDIGTLVLIAQWILIVIGIVFKSIWLNKYHWIHLIIYLLLGWTALIFMDKIYAEGLVFFLLILFGGLAYTVGVVFYVLGSKVKYFHFIWHFFTIAGTLLHTAAIIGFIYT